jgi:drug/metabolite transporter (DMT)-like permease
LQRASYVTQAAVSDGALAIVAIVLTVVSFLVGQAGTSISYLRIKTVDYAHIINEGVVGTAGVTALVGLVAAILALRVGRDVLRSWRKDLAVAALILGVLSAGLHGTLWYMSIQHKPPVQQQGQLGP